MEGPRSESPASRSQLPESIRFLRILYVSPTNLSLQNQYISLRTLSTKLLRKTAGEWEAGLQNESFSFRNRCIKLRIKRVGDVRVGEWGSGRLQI